MSRYEEIHEIFTGIQLLLDSDQELRENIKEKCKVLNEIAREITSVLQIVHYSDQEITEACFKTRIQLERARKAFNALKAVVPPNKVFQCRDQWRSVTQRYCYCIVLLIWLEVNMLVDYEVAAEILGLETDKKKGFYLDLEDFLSGILLVCSEMPRLIVNFASRGDFCRVMHIYRFILSMNKGFGSLDIENDGFRKRIDSLKYDVKKVEDVVYDLGIRGLLKNEIQGAGEKAQKESEIVQESGEKRVRDLLVSLHLGPKEEEGQDAE